MQRVQAEAQTEEKEMIGRRLSIGNRVRRFFGLCPHWWGGWRTIWSASTDPNPFMADDSIALGRERDCTLCGHTQRRYYPDGH